MEAPLLLIAALLVTALVFVVIPVALDAYQRFRHSKVLICPDRRLMAHPAGEVVLTLANAERLRGKVHEGELADSLAG